MEFVEFSHNLWLIVASFAVALMAGFTGLSLTNGLSTYSYTRRKIAISFAAIALGGGIWSMHFVAMLGLQLPFVFYYDAAVTLTSALVAILVVGTALLILHFGTRTRGKLLLAGVIVGVGIGAKKSAAPVHSGKRGLKAARLAAKPGRKTSGDPYVH